MTEALLFSLPFVPVLTRGVLIIAFWQIMKEIPEEDEQDRESHRGHITTLAGFSFSGALAVLLVEATLGIELEWTIYYLVLSFLMYLLALNLQGYKAYRREDQIGDALLEGGSLCLLLALASILMGANIDVSLGPWLAIIALVIWLVDHVLRVKYSFQYLRNRRNVKNDEEQDRTEAEAQGGRG